MLALSISVNNSIKYVCSLRTISYNLKTHETPLMRNNYIFSKLELDYFNNY